MTLAREKKASNARGARYPAMTSSVTWLAPAPIDAKNRRHNHGGYAAAARIIAVKARAKNESLAVFSASPASATVRRRLATSAAIGNDIRQQ